jgi:diketogulonate reductase-like aldo/keto reductase
MAMMPCLALALCLQAVKVALQAGFRHLDNAEM